MKAETKLRVAACAAGFALPRYNDLPSVGLYLDQTVQFVNGYFRSFCGVELTPSMVSNYVKKGVVDHPIRKKYTRWLSLCRKPLPQPKRLPKLHPLRKQRCKRPYLFMDAPAPAVARYIL